MQVRGQRNRRGYKPPPLKKQIAPLADGSMPKEVSTTEMWFRWTAIHLVRCSGVTRFLLVASLVPFGVISAQTPTRTEIEQVVHSFIDAHNRGDAGAIAAMYAQQAGVTSVGDGEIRDPASVG